MESFYGGRKGLDFKIFGCYSSLPEAKSSEAESIPNGCYIVIAQDTSSPSVLYYKNFNGDFQYVGPLFHSPDTPQVEIGDYRSLPSNSEKEFAIIKQNGQLANIQGKVRQRIKEGAITMGFAFPAIKIENDINNVFKLTLKDEDTLTYRFTADAKQGFAISIDSKDDTDGIAVGGAGFF